MKKSLVLLSLSALIASAPLNADAANDGAKSLGRGLISISSVNGGKGNLISWRSFNSDGRDVKFKLYRGTNATTQNSSLNSGKFITGKTNFNDTNGSSSNYYKLEVYDANDELIETVVSEKTWTNQTKFIPLQGGAPTDTKGLGATYSPNDASICDMDGDGEYEIILKWSPSNEKDAASTGNTSPEFFACYKLDGTRLWMLTGGPNMFSSAHTSPFVAWDLDGDGYGEFMIKTGCGAVDGLGNNLSLDTNPKANYLGSNGKQTSGPEWITVFDGRTGKELKTINYHTNYSAGASYWGDSKQNRSERYLASIAWLDGKEKNPSAIFARGYYSGAFIGAYDWNGKDLTLRWHHRALSASNGEVKYANGTTTKLTKTVYGDGAHWMCPADVNRDGKQEITYGSSALKSDGTTLYRTGLGHGDALHVSDFDPSRPGLECFMVHEASPYGCDYRDATTGQILVRKTAGGDTGRGLMALFNPESDLGIFQTSADAALYDASGAMVAASKTWGGGASLQDRIYWTGTLGEDFWGKSIIETWDVNSGNMGRVLGIVNGSNYTSGNTNNSSKNNACLIADILGDWREEVICWTGDAASGYQLIINETNYQTDYQVPHLMEDIDYRAQVITQNCCYNQPPHLGYNLRHSKKLQPELIECEPVDGANAKMGKYWGCIYTSYPVIVPEETTVYNVSGYNNTADTVRTAAIASGKIIPANRAYIVNSKVKNPLFVPTAKASNATVSSLYATGSYSKTTVEDTSAKYVYEFRMGEQGLGFYHTSRLTIEGGMGYGTASNSTSAPAAEVYLLGSAISPTPTAIRNVSTSSADDAIYNIQGMRMKTAPKQGLYIKNGKKIVSPTIR